MPKLTVFSHVSLDGYFVDRNGQMNWAQADQQYAEWNAFVSGNASGDGTLVFGRVTYDMMAGFWPTPVAAQMMPEVAAGMNRAAKVVFSRTLTEASWQNTTLLKGGPADEMRRLKGGTGTDMVILGSGTLVAQLAADKLIDVFQLVVNPVVLGAGRTLFDGVQERLPLRQVESRAFRNGNVLLTYQPL
jgi:dihydrofolate reductase